MARQGNGQKDRSRQKKKQDRQVNAGLVSSKVQKRDTGTYPEVAADIDNIATWIPFRSKLCDGCSGSCCSLPVEVKVADLVRMELLDPFELEEEPRLLARKLRKSGVVEHFHAGSATFTLSRLASGDCLYLDQQTRRCTIYERRPDTCRNHPRVGPRSGYCAFRPKQAA